MTLRGKGYYKGELFSFDLPENWSLLAMAEPKDYRTLARSDHYSNVAQVGRWAIYDKAVVEETVSVLDGWMNGVLASSEDSGSEAR